MDNSKTSSSIVDIVNMLQSVDDKEKAGIFFKEFAEIILKNRYFGMCIFEICTETEAVSSFEVKIFDRENDLHDWLKCQNRFSIPHATENERDAEILGRSQINLSDFMQLAPYKWNQLGYYLSMDNRFVTFLPDDDDE